ncbi:M14 family metallopeptidase [Undibacterium cyanobacteriorum]|uniref:M14 family metallopeptidase n=1 Tax=Undibacterium cyanobacteriorum TaxID=3073561 RepID=A0ABY9RNH6_9BURK|nr:M14 family metallopeptidase [Undibacterium sp. 20NA77.5]WMW81987.1 M14 family metallopeptidase [Undibacterium sp. 20NA77.5]
MHRKTPHSILGFTTAALLLLSSTTSMANAVKKQSNASDLRTTAEKTQFQETGRYEEVERLCMGFERQYPKSVRCKKFGTTPEGRSMFYLVASHSGVLGPQQLKKKPLPVTLIQAGIHAGEIDGKDAGFLALRKLLDQANALRNQVVLFVPVFNVDGHERFDSYNRPNQRGPKAMGWRTTAQNYNLNRDYVKADAPEMQAMLALVNEWDPIATIDLHVTDGAKFQHAVSIQVEPSLNHDHPLATIGKHFQEAVIADLSKKDFLPLGFYMSFDEEDNPMSGFSNNVSTPRFSTGYFQLRNRLAMLVETHSWKDYPTRVQITHDTILSVVKQMEEHGQEWRSRALQADQQSLKLAGNPLALSYRNTNETKTIEFQGYAYSRSTSEISGASMTRYDESKPQVWRVKLQDQVTPDVSTQLPLGGYVVPAAYASKLEDKLKQHGIQFQKLSTAFSAQTFEVFRAQRFEFSQQSIEHHQMLKVEGSWAKETRTLGKNALFIPIQQAKARLVATMFEPLGGDSLLNWGWFNNAFESKEYMEAYVAEEFAREALQASPELHAEFQEKLTKDPAFKANPQKRLEFFAKRHPSWDKAFALYPVMRVDQIPSDVK